MGKILAHAGYTVHIIEWDRTGSKPRIEVKDGIVFKRLRLKAGYGLSTAHLTPFWTVFAFIQMLLGNYDIVQPQNLDCLMPAFLYVKPVRRRRIIYDLADFYSDAFVVGVPFVSWMIKHMERFLARSVDALILASERQILQVGVANLPKKVATFYNAPDVNFSSNDGAGIEEDRFKGEKDEHGFILFYAGQLSHDRVRLLLNVIDAIKGLPVGISIAGFGEYEKYVQHLTAGNKQISYLGFLTHEKVMQLSRKADLILLPYDSSHFNDRIGLPHKLFESMASGALVLAPRNTYLGESVDREKIGFVADYSSLKDIRHVLSLVISAQKSTVQSFKQNAKMLYLEKFSPQKLSEIYLSVVDGCLSEQGTHNSSCFLTT